MSGCMLSRVEYNGVALACIYLAIIQIQDIINRHFTALDQI